MPEDFEPEPQDSAEETEREIKRAPKSGLDSGLALFVGFAFLCVLIYFGIAQGMVALVMFPGLPLVLLWFIYWFFLRRLIRIRRVRQAEERRLLREAAQRGRKHV